MYNPLLGCSVEPVRLDLKQANVLIADILQRLLSGECIRVETICPDDKQVQDYVVMRVASRKWIICEPILTGVDNRLCLIYRRPEWMRLTSACLPDLPEETFLWHEPTGELWDAGAMYDKWNGGRKISKSDLEPTSIRTEQSVQTLPQYNPPMAPCHLWLRGSMVTEWMYQPKE